MPSHGRADGLAPTLAVFAVLGTGLLALFAGYSWFWLVFVLGFAVVVPLVAILASDEGRDQWRDQDRVHEERSGHVRGSHRRRGRSQDRSSGVRWNDRRTDAWWDDLSCGLGWPDPERERERDREVRERFGVPVDTRTAADAGDGAGSDGRPAGTKTAAHGDDEPPVDVQTALEDLRARYARGDITDEQFDDELDRLLGRRDAGSEEPEAA